MAGDKRVCIHQLFDIEQFGPQHHVPAGECTKALAHIGQASRCRLLCRFESAARLFMDEMRKVVDIEFVAIKVVLIASPHSRKKLPQHLVDCRDQLRRGGECTFDLQHERHFIVHVDAVYVRERISATLQQCLAIGRFVACALALGFQPTDRRSGKVDQAGIWLGQRRGSNADLSDAVNQFLDTIEEAGFAACIVVIGGVTGNRAVSEQVRIAANALID